MDKRMNGILNRCIYSLIRLIYGCKHFLTDPNHWASISPYIVYNYLRYHGVDLEFGSVKIGLHPPGWTKYVRVVGRIEHPGKREKGSCHEESKKIPHRT